MGRSNDAEGRVHKPRLDGVFGARVKTLRQALGFTMHQVAESAGLAPSTISKIEQGRLSPTYENILKLASGLRVDVAELFSESSSPMTLGRRSVTLSGAGAKLYTAQYDYEMLCPELSNKIFTPLLTRIKARSSKEFSGYVQHAGEEFIYVISGTIVLQTNAYKDLTLKMGDSCYFDSMMGHLCISTGDDDAIILWVCSQVFFPELDKDGDSEPVRLVQPSPATRFVQPRRKLGNGTE